jgi:hypothetical protein
VDTVAEGEWVDVEYVFVDEAFGRQGGEQGGAAHQEQIAAGLLLERGDLLHEIGLAEDGGVSAPAVQRVEATYFGSSRTRVATSLRRPSRAPPPACNPVAATASHYGTYFS